MSATCLFLCLLSVRYGDGRGACGVRMVSIFFLTILFPPENFETSPVIIIILFPSSVCCSLFYQLKKMLRTRVVRVLRRLSTVSTRPFALTRTTTSALLRGTSRRSYRNNGSSSSNAPFAPFLFSGTGLAAAVLLKSDSSTKAQAVGDYAAVREVIADSLDDMDFGNNASRSHRLIASVDSERVYIPTHLWLCVCRAVAPHSSTHSLTQHIHAYRGRVAGACVGQTSLARGRYVRQGVWRWWE